MFGSSARSRRERQTKILAQRLAGLQMIRAEEFLDDNFGANLFLFGSTRVAIA